MEPKGKLLLVDDDADLVQVMKGTLENNSYQVVVAYNGRDGIEKARAEKPDLVVLDILMPVADGFSFAQQFHKDPQLTNIPVIALTSFSESLGQPFEFEVSEYVQKPIKPRELLAKIEHYLKKKPA